MNEPTIDVVTSKMDRILTSVEDGNLDIMDKVIVNAKAVQTYPRTAVLLSKIIPIYILNPKLQQKTRLT